MGGILGGSRRVGKQAEDCMGIGDFGKMLRRDRELR